MTLTTSINNRIPTGPRPPARPRPSTRGLKVAQRPEGWLELSRPWKGDVKADLLVTHAGWTGPVKLVKRHNQWEQRTDIFLGPASEVSLMDEEAVQCFNGLMEELIELGGTLGDASTLKEWSPPAPEILVGWLTEAGYETAIDKDKNIRLTLKRPGCEGEVRGKCTEGRLRFTMALGNWPELDTTSDQAMHLLARFVNDHSRLVRIGLLEEDAARRFEALVDLTGLPLCGEANPFRDRMGREMIRLALKGLELALKQLGLELPLLADPRHRDLALLLLDAAK